MAFRHLHLDWSRPLVDEAARRLAAFAEGSHPADFRRVALVLPTAEAGRQLRTALLEALADRGGITRLRILTAETLLHPDGAELPEADSASVLVCWSEVLRRELQNHADEYRELLPSRIVPDLLRETALRLGVARRLHEWRLELAGAGWSLAGAVNCFDAACRENPDEELEGRFRRFREFQRLETLCRRELAHRFPGVRDPAAAVLAAIAAPRLPPEVERLIVIDAPHLGRGIVRLLRALEVPVEIWINAPEEYAEHFDEAGRPDPEFWSRLPMKTGPVERKLRICASPGEQARKLYSFAGGPENSFAVFGVLDPEVATSLCRLREIDPAAERPRFFWPQPRPLTALPWSRLLLALLALAENGDPPVSAVEALFAHERCRRYLCRRFAIDDWRRVLSGFDTLRAGTLAPTLRTLLAACSGEPLRSLISLCRDWCAEFHRAGSLIDALFEVFGAIGSAAVLPGEERGRDAEAELSQLRRCAAEVRRAAGNDRETAAALLRMRLADVTIAAPSSPGAVELIGFAELNWRRETGLVIAGCNEEFFHPSEGADPLLPETARRMLGMTVADDWYAVDALRFGGLCASRDLRLLCGRASNRGDVLHPARLLMQLPREELPARVAALFSDRLLEPAGTETPRRAEPWLRPRRMAPSGKMRITGFRRYLESPFHFYLEQILGAAECDERAFEMDNLQFGTLTHAVLEEYARRGAELKDAEAIREFCFAALESAAGKHFGGSLGGIPRLQIELMRDSLRYFAEAQERRRAEGWRILAAEHPVECGWAELLAEEIPETEPRPWRDGILLRGTIDRIDFLPGDPGTGGAGHYAIIDYKTGAKAKSPAETHLGAFHEAWREAAGAFPGGRRRQWTDLQLPLYWLLLRHGRVAGIAPGADDAVSAAYFNLPLELTATGIRDFPELADPAFRRSAFLCADETLRRIFEERLFWPPVPPAYFPGAAEPVCRFDLTSVMPPECWQPSPEEEAPEHE